MATLLIADHDGAKLGDATAKALTAAALVGHPVDILVAGENVHAIAEAAARLDGVAKVLVADGATLANLLAEPLAELVVGLADRYAVIAAPASSAMKNALPRVAAKLDVMQISEVTAVVAPDTFERPIYAGNAIETVRSREPKLVMTIRGAAFTATASGDASAPIEAITAPGASAASQFLGADLTTSTRPELGSARIIVSGGRALGSAEKFDAVLAPLADKLGAAVGASRAAVDSGYAPNDLQVGQTGKVVAPELYIALGISGAIQHLAGMKDSKIIVAVNKDPDAPIFQIADYGLEEDLFTAVPAMLEALK
ncbi:electron transfer flavoprotein subunit alpha/FixB family protein [Kaistia terrae]|uniref:Electron transfer flavoprotein subunit alpha/FixB family protein n=1 Tax=Kaistia terrae TaxID=537017 RepID=A0ABW0PP97_9HYPH|nr:FAD-binding protein [Kaistia terrae]MCX5577705.1 FAD-binding protein [Kaistia terrae]